PSRGLQVSDARRLVSVLAALAVVLLALGVAALFVGSAGLSPAAVARALAGRALAVAGVGFQALTRNPLAEPSVLGVSSGAAFGVVLAQILGLQAGVV